jgi:hypothetical protein
VFYFLLVNAILTAKGQPIVLCIIYANVYRSEKLSVIPSVGMKLKRIIAPLKLMFLILFTTVGYSQNETSNNSNIGLNSSAKSKLYHYNLFKAPLPEPKASTIIFEVTDGVSPIKGASINISGFDDVKTDELGEAVLQVVNGEYSFIVEAEGYVSKSNLKFVVDGETIILSIELDLDDLTSNSLDLNNLRAFPNPFNNQISFTLAERIVRVVVTNLIGQQVMDGFTNGQGSIGTSELSSGVYLIMFVGENNGRIVRKMVKR